MDADSVGPLNLMRGRVENADRLLKSALALYPEYHYALAKPWQSPKTAQGRLDEAVQAFRDLYRVAPHPENLYLLAKSLERAGRTEECMKAFSEFEQKALAESIVTDNSNRELVLLLCRRGRQSVGSSSHRSNGDCAAATIRQLSKRMHGRFTPME
jgi:tetratricopeptide (TPR) repeat protein